MSLSPFYRQRQGSERESTCPKCTAWSSLQGPCTLMDQTPCPPLFMLRNSRQNNCWGPAYPAGCWNLNLGLSPFYLELSLCIHFLIHWNDSYSFTFYQSVFISYCCYNKFSGLKPHEFMLFLFWSSKVCARGAGRATFFPQALGQNCFLSFSRL